MAGTQVRTQARRAGSDRSTLSGLQVGMGLALVAIGLIVWQQRRAHARPRRPMRDYSRRSGFPLGVEAAHGAASDAPIPQDMLTPDALRPLNSAPR